MIKKRETGDMENAARRGIWGGIGERGENLLDTFDVIFLRIP